MGRVNPKHFKFALNVEHKRYDLPQFLRQQILNAEDIRTVVKEVEPRFAGYRRTEKALESYLELAREDNDAVLPVLKKTVEPGDPYPSVTRLARFLRLVGDLPVEATAAPNDTVYQGVLVEAVKRFQRRHGLASDGRLGRETLE
jgi:murein L,D-transpeptidase YcbB/YkuD